MGMNIENTYKEQFAWGDPVNYEGIILYPVRVEHLYLFQTASSCLQINPAELNDIRYKSMSRLKFILETFKTADSEESNNSLFKAIPICFTLLMKLVLGKNQTVNLIHPTEPKLTGKILHIHRNASESDAGADLIITPKKFDEFRRVILLQNGVDITDEEVDPIMRMVYMQDMERLHVYDHTTITEEDKFDLVSLALNTSRNSLKTMPLREYRMKTEKLLAKDIYVAQIQGQMSGFVKFNKEPRHWLDCQTNKEKILSHFRTEDDIKGLLDAKE